MDRMGLAVDGLCGAQQSGSGREEDDKGKRCGGSGCGRDSRGGTHVRLERNFGAALYAKWVGNAAPTRMARCWPAEEGDSPSKAEVEALSQAARGLTGENGLSFLRFVLNAWTTGNRLHTAVVLSCLAGCERGGTDTRAHYVVPADSRLGRGSNMLRLWRVVGSGVVRFCGDMRSGAGCASRRRMVLDTLGCHRLRALWREGGCPPHSTTYGVHVQVGAQVFREVAATVRAGRSDRAIFRRIPRSGRARDGVGC